MATTAALLPGAPPPVDPNQNPPAPPTSQGIPVDSLNREHPIVSEYKKTWALIALLYEGGAKIKASAEVVLRRKAKELEELYRARKEALTYQNVLGSGVDYYLACIFESEPEMDTGFRQPDGSIEGGELAADQKAFYDAFKKNCDRQTNSFVQMFRDVLLDVLLYRNSWILLDLP